VNSQLAVVLVTPFIVIIQLPDVPRCLKGLIDELLLVTPVGILKLILIAVSGSIFAHGDLNFTAKVS